ncbi:Yet2p NDAI_0B01310 [Naumovozyma dairenensis CBS 421]|uniref:Endoplasmic reticulum transmembrane protein n=1 Tax=Naumovozyma dairenensis (strain ATCC 10597 / BCRC 20456 / CBS 421 / NBRC 0211 / NRRL Y-12639) TaxID=1071378 RepID=G0W5V4_NAUDC|nr:hypothetical protein NDAI_0B01310 [Naumovozyma dairenensis CBS 421]CCD23165.1 hypothetical protein NDAI_0B01310 [Naumovozyma dairenensis CBS 421]
MSIYLLIIFFSLIMEMTILFILVLPLPFSIRRLFFSLFERATKSMQVRTISSIFGLLVSFLFYDSRKRSMVHVLTYQDDVSGQNVTPIHALASRAYHQRNMYLSGFILYFGVCIATVMTILGKLVKVHDDMHMRELGNIEYIAKSRIDDLIKLKHEKEQNLRDLKLQVAKLKTASTSFS